MPVRAFLLSTRADIATSEDGYANDYSATNDDHTIELARRGTRSNLNDRRSFLVATVRRMSSLVGRGGDALENEIPTG